MEKQKRDILITSALVLIFIASFLKNIVFNKPKVPQAANAEISEVPADLSFLGEARKNRALLKAQRAAADTEWKRDPFQKVLSGSPAQASGDLSRLTLNGIVWDESQPYAMVNGDVIKVGDVIESFTVVQIKQGTVVLWSEAGKFEELQLFAAPEITQAS